MWKVVEVMAKVIEFHVPDRMRERQLLSSPEQRGKVIEFPSVESEYAVAATAPRSRARFSIFLNWLTILSRTAQQPSLRTHEQWIENKAKIL